MCDTPDYLEAADNEDLGSTCEYDGYDAWEGGRYPELCFECNMEAERDAYHERLAEEQADREMFPEDYFDGDWL